jgi:penicillin-binding protein 2
MAAPMVRNFFEPLKEDIKDIIAPPMKALVVIPEGEGGGLDGALRAIPVEDPNVLEDTDFEEILRAIPVDEEEVSEGFSGDEEEGF